MRWRHTLCVTPGFTYFLHSGSIAVLKVQRPRFHSDRMDPSAWLGTLLDKGPRRPHFESNHLGRALLKTHHVSISINSEFNISRCLSEANGRLDAKVRTMICENTGLPAPHACRGVRELSRSATTLHQHGLVCLLCIHRLDDRHDDTSSASHGAESHCHAAALPRGAIHDPGLAACSRTWHRAPPPEVIPRAGRA